MYNIAEGLGRGSKLEFINSHTIAEGEAEELKSQPYRGLDIRYCIEVPFREWYELTELVAQKVGPLFVI